MAQYFRLSLNKPPDVLGIGSYDTRETVQEWHQSSDQWQFIAAAHGGIVTCNSFEVRFEPRSLLVFPPRARCKIRREGALPYHQAYCWFRPTQTKEDEVAVPQCVAIHDRWDSLNYEFRRAIDRLPFSRTSRVALAWQVLWSIAQGPQNVRRSVYVEQAEELIHTNLSERLRVEDLASTLQISPSQLVRLFRQEHGTTVQEYIRLARVNLACRLLTSTTEPIKSIAVRCGVPELSNFGKLIRDSLGSSPRQIRSERKVPTVFVDLGRESD